MKLKLTTEDRNAIDLLLDHTASVVGAPSQSYAAAAGADHLRAVGNVLKLLQVLPMCEPPADLVTRTLARISQVSGQVMAGQVMAGQISQAPAMRADRPSSRPA